MVINFLKEDLKNIILIEGSINFDSIDQFKYLIQDAILDSRDLILDFTKVDYINSQGLGILARNSYKLKQMGKEMIIRNPNENIKKLFFITRVDNIAKIEEKIAN